jgi:hypothetical protein
MGPALLVRTIGLMIVAGLPLAGPWHARGVEGAPAPPRDTVWVAAPTGQVETDRVQVQEAFDRVQPGDTVRFAAGMYVLGEGARLTVSDVTVLGHPDGTVLRGCDPERFEFAEGFGMDDVVAIAMGCTGLFVLADRQIIRGLTFDHTWHGIYVGHLPSPSGDPPTEPGFGGHRIENNVFRNVPNGIRVVGPTDAPTMIRDNEAVNAYHAFQSNGAIVHILDNRITVPEPQTVPAAYYPESGVILSPGPASASCAGSRVVGNVVEGTVHGIQVLAGGSAWGGTCSDHEIRDNEIRLRQIPLPTGYPRNLRDFYFGEEAEGSAVTGTAIRLHGELLGPADGGAATITNVVIQDNRIVGGHGLGIQLARASGNRIVGNQISAIRRRSPFPGLTWGDDPNRWREANGSAIWISEGSDENLVAGNIFTEIEGPEVYVAGDRNDIRVSDPAAVVRDEGRGNRVTETRIDLPEPTGDRARDHAAVAEAFERVEPGGTIAFAAGTYLVGSEGLFLRTPGVTLQGHPDGSTLVGCTTEERADLDFGDLYEMCNGFMLAAEEQRVTGLRFESFNAALYLPEPTAVGAATTDDGPDRPTSFTGGHVIEDNTFQDVGSVDVGLDADSTVWIRRNVFRNTWHAVALGGRNIRVSNNLISAPEPERVPGGFTGVAVGIRPDVNGACSDIVVEGNRIEGHTEGVIIAVLPQDPPGAVCSDITVRRNEIVMRPLLYPEDSSRGDRAGRLAIAPAIRLMNAQRAVSEGAIDWPERWMPDGGWPTRLSEGRVSNVLVEGNRISGAVGVAIELIYASDNRITDNEIEVRPAATRAERDGLTLGGNLGPGLWVELGLVGEVNGTPVWVSPGSERNVVRNPQ